jgi:hypothetical protein
MRRPRLPPASNWADALAQELEGLIDLGATKEATKVLRQILRLRKPTALALWQVVRAAGMMDRPRRWRRDIESAYARLSKAEQRRAHSAMFDYYYAIGESQSALAFCKAKDLRSPHALMFAMDLYLETDDLVQAKNLARKCRKMTLDNPFDASAVAEALASYYARIRKWDQALRLWELAPRDQPVSRQAALGRVEVFLARAWAAVQEELDVANSLRKNVDPELALSLPGVEKDLLDQTKKDLSRFKRGLERLLPEQRRHALGLP